MVLVHQKSDNLDDSQFYQPPNLGDDYMEC